MKSDINYVRRPWVQYWDTIPFDTKNLDQQMKLIRNLVASMDLGIPGFNLYDSIWDTPNREQWWNRTERNPRPSGRERYLEWVAEWKKSYSSLSECIRQTRSQRTRRGFSSAMTLAKQDSWSNLKYEDNLSRVRTTLESLRIAAQIMLNARAIGKLASAQIRHREMKKKGLKLTPAEPVVLEA